MPRNIIFQLHVIVIPAKNITALFVSSQISHSSLYLSQDFHFEVHLVISRENALTEVLGSGLTSLTKLYLVKWLITRAVPELCLELGDAISNLQPCHEFVFCHK